MLFIMLFSRHQTLFNMKIFSGILAASLSLATVSNMEASLIDTEMPSSLFNLGLRAGINTSVHTFDSKFFNTWNINSWGTGFDAGVVFDINLRRYLAIQPGFFFESRSGHYSYVHTFIDENQDITPFSQLGHYCSYYFNIPVMVSLRFSLADNVKWLVEAGPYLQLKLHSSDSENIDVFSGDTYDSPLPEQAKANSSDFGLKLGSGILVNDHYSFSIHYLAGMRDVWKKPFNGGRNKAWTFTVGYNF